MLDIGNEDLAVADLAGACGFFDGLNGALEHVGTWLSLDPFDPAAHVEHGNIQLQRGVFDRAMYAYETALAYDKNNFPAQVNLAGVYERLGFRWQRTWLAYRLQGEALETLANT